MTAAQRIDEFITTARELLPSLADGDDELIASARQHMPHRSEATDEILVAAMRWDSTPRTLTFHVVASRRELRSLLDDLHRAARRRGARVEITSERIGLFRNALTIQLSGNARALLSPAYMLDCC